MARSISSVFFIVLVLAGVLWMGRVETYAAADEEAVAADLEAQRDLTVLHLVAGRQADADGAIDAVLDNFADHARLPHTLHEIAERSASKGQGVAAGEMFARFADEPGREGQRIWLKMAQAISENIAGNSNERDAVVSGLVAEYGGDLRVVEAVAQVAWNCRKTKDYERARQLYGEVVERWGDNERAIFSQRGIIWANMALKDDAAAEAGADDLLGNFAGNAHLGEVVSSVAGSFRKAKKYDRAKELHKYVVDNCLGDERAIWSQKAIVDIEMENNKDVTAALAAVDELKGRFAGDKQLAGAICESAWTFRKCKKYEDAVRMYSDVVKNFVDSEYALPAQRGIIWAKIAVEDTEGADAAVEKLLNDFAGNSRVAGMIADVAGSFRKKRDHERALGLYRHIADNYPQSEQAIAAGRYVVLCNLNLGADVEAAGALESLLDRFSNDERLAKQVYEAAEGYRGKKKHDIARGLYEYVIDNFGGDENAVWSVMGLAKILIAEGDDTAVEVIIDDYMANYPDDKNLARMLFHLGSPYYHKGVSLENKGTPLGEKNLRRALLIIEKAIYDLPEVETYTAEALRAAAECHRSLRELDFALMYYKKLSEDWPGYRSADYVLYLVASCYRKLAQAGDISVKEGVDGIRQACNKLLEKYPDSRLTKQANGFLESADRMLEKERRAK